MMIRAFSSAIFAIALMVGAVSPAEANTKVVATFSILGDMVRNVGGDKIELTTLVGPNGDAHVYTPQPKDAVALAKADLVFVNGLGFEGWIDRLIEASGTSAPVAVATEGIEPHAMKGETLAQGATNTDPHAWQTLQNGIVYVRNIAKALVTADPQNAGQYRANADAYIAKLEALDARAKRLIAALPEARRKVVTAHDAFGYFERAYGIEFLAPIGVSTEGEASAADVAQLITQIHSEGISAVFVENITDPSLVQQISRETGVAIGGRIFSDALSGPDEPASTYLKMFEHNISLLTAAMRGSS